MVGIHYGLELDYLGKKMRVIRSGETTCTLQDLKGNRYAAMNDDILEVVK